MRKILVILALTIILLLAVSSDEDLSTQTTDCVISPNTGFSPAYTTHSPIVIESNADFISQGWNGTGSAGDPFLIENLSIHQDIKNGHCILINDTDVHFKIQNCLLTGVEAKSGIYLKNVTNGVINTNTIDTQSYELYGVWTFGIALDDSDYNTISNNTCTFEGHGIDLYGSHHNEVLNNTCNGGSDGLWLVSSSSNAIVNNTSGNHTQGALYVSGGSNNILENNYLWNSQRGLVLLSTSSNTIVNNTMVSCGMWFASEVYAQAEVSGNTVNELDLCYYHSQSDFVIDQPIGQIILFDCTNFIIEDIEIIDSTIGIFVRESENGVIRNVTSKDHAMYAIEIQLSRNINVSQCRMIDSGGGLHLFTYFAILDSAHFITNCTFEGMNTGIIASISNCTIKWNTFSVINAISSSSYYENNFFQYNYYENYLGIDGDGDGFGDTPYVISGDANDSYPLMYEPTNPEWIVVPTDSTFLEGSSYSQPIYATSESPLVHFEVSDTTNFSFDESSVLESAIILEPGVYYIELTIKNIYNRTLKTDLVITVLPETVPPSINSVVDLVFELGEVGHVLEWTPSDVHPHNYSIFLDDVLVRSGAWNSSSEVISVSLDGLSEGIHNYTILVLDSRGNSALDEVVVEVYVDPPTLSGVDMISFVHGTTDNYATWSSSGTFPQNYSLYMNGHFVRSNLWNSSSESIAILLDTLDVGIYSYRLIVNNSAGADDATTIVYVFADEYQTHAPILIQSDSDFVTQNWPGSGTAEDPYIIAGLNITGNEPRIFIDDTTSHFIIFDCYFNTPEVYTGESSIQLWRLDNGAIISCTFVSVIRAVDVWWSNSISIRDCIFENVWDTCIAITTVDGFEVLNCSVEIVANNGISIYKSTNGVVDNCNLYGDGNYPFNIDQCTNLVISNNVFGVKGLRITGDFLIQYTTIHLLGNIVNGKSIGWFVNESNIVLDGTIYGQYILINCSQVTLNGGTFDYGYLSVYLVFCKNCTVDGVSAYESSGNPIFLNWCADCVVRNCNIERPVNRGIMLHNSIRCIIYDNIVEFPSEGVALWRCGGCIIYGNTFNGGYAGVYLVYSNLTLIFDNILDYNQIGVYLDNVANITIDSNLIRYNRWSGLEVGYSQYCVMINNTLKFNDEYGIHVYSTSSNCLFYLNKLGNNVLGNALDDGVSNDWDNGSIGNWWRDYSGSGVYNISGDANSTDHYPQFLLYVHIPIIVTPLDMQYDVGTTGNLLVWDLTNYYSGMYFIYRNGIVVDWKSLTDHIYLSVDGLSIGYYEFTIDFVQDGYENVTDTVYVTVVFDTTDPTIDSPEDISYIVGITGNRISWTPSDLNPNYYEIYQDGILIDNGTWIPSWTSINVTVDGLAVGIYSYTLKVSDILWHNATDTVQVSVLAEPTTSTTTTSTTSETTSTTDTDTGTDTSTGTDTNPEMLTITLVMVLIGSGIVVVIVVVLIIRSKAPGT